jgi:hypothetical protein
MILYTYCIFNERVMHADVNELTVYLNEGLPHAKNDYMFYLHPMHNWLGQL